MLRESAQRVAPYLLVALLVPGGTVLCRRTCYFSVGARDELGPESRR